jgi:hypothetical protein
VTDNAAAIALLRKRRDYLASSKTVQEYLELNEAIEELRGSEAVKAVHKSALPDYSMEGVSKSDIANNNANVEALRGFHEGIANFPSPSDDTDTKAETETPKEATT